MSYEPCLQIHRRASDRNRRKHYKGSWLDKPFALSLIIVLSPVMLLNVLMACMLRKPITEYQEKGFNGQRKVKYAFSEGVLRGSSFLFLVLTGQFSLCGVAMETQLTSAQRQLLSRKFVFKSALIDATTVRTATGSASDDAYLAVKKQFEGNSLDYFILCLKGLFCYLVYRSKERLSKPSLVPLFGFSINNDSMNEAVKWTIADSEQCKVGIFINAHSVNVAARDENLRYQLKRCQRLFADGSFTSALSLLSHRR